MRIPPSSLELALVLAALLLAASPLRADEPPPEPNRYFAIEVVDDQTGRGVPAVELQSTTGARYYTDSAGRIAFYEPGQMNRRVFFAVASHGYEGPKDGFGIRGVVFETRPGTSATIKVKRLNIAERLYRLTGYGIYRDSVLLGHRPPIAEPLLNAEITGQDGILTTVYRGTPYWFYGDTGRLAYALGNFGMTGAVCDPPDRLDPDAGISLRYFTGPDGFARPMAPIPGGGVVWLYGVVAIPDATGRERMTAFFLRLKELGKPLEQGFMVFNDDTETFEKSVSVPLDAPFVPTHYPFPVTHPDGTRYQYFPAPYPALRVPATLERYTDLAAYEAYTCLQPGTRFENAETARLDRDAEGRLVWSWKAGTPPLTPPQQAALVKAGRMTRQESPQRLQDAETGAPVQVHNASCFWNDFRQRYVLIASETGGATPLGELWYSEADRPEGPWVHARKIITHANKPGDAHDFYNPTQHPFLDRSGGRFIYIEGTYTNAFSGNPHPTPYYEYNQILYRLDLSDPRLKLPDPPNAASD